jgi:ribosomal protein L37AE/L43A
MSEWDEDVEERRCRYCHKKYLVKRGQKVRHCPYCGAAQTRGAMTHLVGDPRRAKRL